MDIKNVLKEHRDYLNTNGKKGKRADLSEAYFRGAIGNNKEIKSFQFGTYLITTHKDNICVVIKLYTVEEWLNFKNDEIDEMDEGYLDFYNKFLKPFLLFYKINLLEE